MEIIGAIFAIAAMLFPLAVIVSAAIIEGKSNENN